MNNKLSIALIIAVCSIMPLLATAGTTTQSPDLGASLPKISNPIDNPKLSVSIPGFLSFRNAECNGTECIVPWIADYIDAIYRYGIAVIGILAVLVLMFGGIMWLTAGGKEERIKQAKEYIGSSLLGVVIAVSSFAVLNIINPTLTQLSPIRVAYIENKDLDQTIPPEDLTPQYTSSSLPTTNLGTSQGSFKVPVLYQGRFKSQLEEMGPCGCGPTSLTMILNFFGDNSSAVDVAKECQKAGYWNTGGGGCGWRAGMDGFKKLLEKRGLKTKQTSGSSIDDAIALLQYGPVIASTTSANGCKCVFPRGTAHYVVFTGYTNGILYTNDPNEANHSRSWEGKTIDTQQLDIATVKKCCKLNMGAITAYK